MRPYLLLVSGLVTWVLAPGALAQQTEPTDAESADLRERLEAQENRLRELENRQDEEQALEQRLEEQQQRIDQLESSRFDSSGSGGRGPEVDVSGFINAGFQSTNLGKTGPTYRNTDNELRATNFTSAGVQIDGRVTDKVSGTVQLLALGTDNFDTETEWAYLSYKMNPSLKFRAGRLVLPFYMNSQSYYVNYAHPWVSPPAEVYDTAPLRSVEGADVTWQFNTGEIAHSLNYYFGSTQVDSGFVNTQLEQIPYDVHNSTGINLSSTIGNMNTWLAYSSGDVSLNLSNAPTPPSVPAPTTYGAYTLDNDSAYFGSAGFEYDDGNLLVEAEYVELDIKSDWIPKSNAQYVTLGYRFGSWTPHVTWAASEDTTYDQAEEDPRPLTESLYNNTKTHQKSWTLGVRNDVAPGLALKAEVSTYYDIGASDDGGANDSGFFSGPIPADEDDPMVFRLAANLVF